jgi:hypothetical protein
MTNNSSTAPAIQVGHWVGIPMLDASTMSKPVVEYALVIERGVAGSSPDMPSWTPVGTPMVKVIFDNDQELWYEEGGVVRCADFQ